MTCRAACAGVLVFAAALACDSKPKRHAATGTLVFDPGPIYSPTADPSEDDPAKTYLATQAEIIRSRAILQRVADDFRLSEADQRELEGGLSATRKGDALILEVRVALADPNKASLLCNAVLKAYLDELVSRELSLDDKRRAYLESAISELQDGGAQEKVEALQKTLAELDVSSRLRSPPVRVLDPCATPK